MVLKRNHIVIIISVLVLGAIIWGLLPGPAQVEVAAVKRGPLTVTVEEEAKTRVREKFVVSAPVAGYMRRVAFDVGDPVSKGQTVSELEPLKSAVLDPRSRATAQAEASAAQASVKAAEETAKARQAEYDYARENLERTRELFRSGYVPKNTMDRVESDFRQAQANLQAAEADVKAARSELERARASLAYSPADNGTNGKAARAVQVKAPVSGRVLKIYRESEGVIGSGEPIMDVGDIATLEVRAEVLSADAVKIERGATVFFERWGGDGVLKGKVRVVEPAAFTKVSSLGVEEQRVIVIADITAAPEVLQRLGDGYRVEAGFVTWEGDNVLQVPSSALFRVDEENAVFVIKEGRARQQMIKVGHRNGFTAEVLSGLSEGEEVIDHPDDSIKDGVRVRKRK